MIIYPRGNPKNLWIVGQNPGKHDTAAFTGPCRWIEEYISGYFTNVCWHRKLCHCVYFWQDWVCCSPTVMLILGSIAWRRITGLDFTPGSTLMINDCKLHCLYHPSGANMGNRTALIKQLEDARDTYMGQGLIPSVR